MYRKFQPLFFIVSFAFARSGSLFELQPAVVKPILQAVHSGDGRASNTGCRRQYPLPPLSAILLNHDESTPSHAIKRP